MIKRILLGIVWYFAMITQGPNYIRLHVAELRSLKGRDDMKEYRKFLWWEIVKIWAVPLTFFPISITLIYYCM